MGKRVAGQVREEQRRAWKARDGRQGMAGERSMEKGERTRERKRNEERTGNSGKERVGKWRY